MRNFLANAGMLYKSKKTCVMVFSCLKPGFICSMKRFDECTTMSEAGHAFAERGQFFSVNFFSMTYFDY